jgi:hypothetical protein
LELQEKDKQEDDEDDLKTRAKMPSPWLSAPLEHLTGRALEQVLFLIEKYAEFEISPIINLLRTLDGERVLHKSTQPLSPKDS